MIEIPRCGDDLRLAALRASHAHPGRLLTLAPRKLDPKLGDTVAHRDAAASLSRGRVGWPEAPPPAVFARDTRRQLLRSCIPVRHATSQPPQEPGRSGADLPGADPSAARRAPEPARDRRIPRLPRARLRPRRLSRRPVGRSCVLEINSIALLGLGGSFVCSAAAARIDFQALVDRISRSCPRAMPRHSTERRSSPDVWRGDRRLRVLDEPVLSP